MKRDRNDTYMYMYMYMHDSNIELQINKITTQGLCELVTCRSIPTAVLYMCTSHDGRTSEPMQRQDTSNNQECFALCSNPSVEC